MIKIGILGAAGYTGGELIRLLLNHPEAEIVFANSASNAGNPVSSVHSGLIGETDLHFCGDLPQDFSQRMKIFISLAMSIGVIQLFEIVQIHHGQEIPLSVL